MDEVIRNKTTVEEEQTTPIETSDQNNEEDPLKEVINEQLRKIQRQNLLLGAQTICHTVLEKILKVEMQPGKRTMNDYRRLIKDIRHFCEIGISRKVNTDGETESIDNNTKLMEEVDDQN